MRALAGILAAAAVIGFHGPVLARLAPAPGPREDLFRLVDAVKPFSVIAADAPAGKF